MEFCSKCIDGICTCEKFLLKYYGVEKIAPFPETKGIARYGKSKKGLAVRQIDPNCFEYMESTPIEPIEFLKEEDLDE